MSEEQPAHEPEEQEEEEEREDDFVPVYANNTRFEPSVWDLKVFFGQLQQHTGKPEVDWHVAVTMPWAHAKVLSYYLLANLVFRQHVDGPIAVPDTVKPPKPEPPSIEMIEQDPGAQGMHELLSEIHSRIFG